MAEDGTVLVLGLEDRFLSILITVCTQAMGRLAVCHLWLKRESEGAGIVPLKFVALFLTFPCFEAHNLLFKIAYALGGRRLCRLRSHEGGLSVEHEALKFDLHLIDLNLRVCSVQSLNNAHRRLQACVARANLR